MAEASSKQSKPHFDIHPSVVFRLGDELISDEIQALVELIKNSYDADATYARVRVSTDEVLGEGYTYPDARGYIIIEDDGIGMDEKTIENGWLIISNSIKANMKAQKETTKKFGRSPQGDKGLGRLGAQRLGNNLEIFTKPINIPHEYHVSFTWEDFRTSKVLSEVPVKFDNVPPSRKAGTRLVISNLNNSSIWEGDNAINALKTALSRLISPFSQIRDYHIDLRINGITLDLAEIADELRKTALLRYEVKFLDNTFHVTGLAKLDYFNPAKKDRQLYHEIVEIDQGQAMLEYLMSSNKGESIHIRASDRQGWYIQYELILPFENIDGLLTIAMRDEDGNTMKDEDGNEIQVRANPGDFYGEVDFFQFDQGAEQQNVFDKLSDYKDYIRDLSGIGIYRDGFGIRVDTDWLNLRSAATSGASRYVLRPDNTIGFIAISAANNPDLKETTSREGFIANPFYKNFYTMLRRFVDFSEYAQNYIRRGWIGFRNANDTKRVEGVVEDTSPKHISTEMSNTLGLAKEYRMNLARSAEQLQQAIDTNSQNIPKSADSKSLERIVEESLTETKNVLSYLDTLSERSTLPEILSRQFEQLQYQLSQTYETMSLGLTAEALSHEISNITEYLGQRTEQVLRYLKQNNLKDVKVLSYIENVRSSIAALRKQLSHFTPSLKYVREKRETINLSTFFEDLRGFYSERFVEKHINLQLEQEAPSDFSLFINRGKLTQIFDNLILNSEYWLQEDMRLNYIHKGEIIIVSDKPFIRFSDNGRGIDPTVETTLFEPFVTTKIDNQGRGLGLFIIQQLLDSEGCSITLLPDRNENNRLYVFEFNMANRISSNG